MPKFLIQASYTADGLKGLRKETAVGRKANLTKIFKEMGGKLESMHFALGKYDVVAIGEFPDTVTATAFALAASATGMVRTSTTVLLTPEEIDKAFAKTGSYKAPGNG